MSIDKDMLDERGLGIRVKEGTGCNCKEPEDCWQCEKRLEGPHVA